MLFMYSKLLPSTSFYIQRLVRAQPFACATLALTLLMAIVAGLVFARLRDAVSDAAHLERTLGQSSLSRPRKIAEPALTGQVSLQPFNSTQMVQVLNDVAARSNVELNEIAFTLDDANGQPYLRYRASFAVSTRYLAVRRFIDGVHAELPDASLDSLACVREAISAQLLKCDLVFTGFYRRNDHG